jgi:hypothetical protein
MLTCVLIPRAAIVSLTMLVAFALSILPAPAKDGM